MGTGIWFLSPPNPFLHPSQDTLLTYRRGTTFDVGSATQASDMKARAALEGSTGGGVTGTRTVASLYPGTCPTGADTDLFATINRSISHLLQCF